MPLRYVINIVLTVALWGVFAALIAQGIITNYWSGILVTIGINIILAVSLNVATGYLGQLPLGHAGFMAVGAYAGGIYMKTTPLAELLRADNTLAALPYIIIALLLSGVVAGIFGLNHRYPCPASERRLSGHHHFGLRRDHPGGSDQYRLGAGLQIHLRCGRTQAGA